MGSETPSVAVRASVSPSCSGRGVTAAENGRPNRSPCTAAGLETSRPAIRSSALSGVPAARSAIAVITSPGRSAPAAGPFGSTALRRRRNPRRLPRPAWRRAPAGGCQSSRARVAACRLPAPRRPATPLQARARCRFLLGQSRRRRIHQAQTERSDAGLHLSEREQRHARFGLVTRPPGLPNNGRMARSAATASATRKYWARGSRRQ